MERNNQIIIHVGFHKTGSTFIQDYFCKHPNVLFLKEEFSSLANGEGEIPLIEEEISSRTIFISNMRLTVNSWGLSEYDRVFKVLSSTEIREHQLKIAKDLKKLFPNAKILITREKNDLLKSLYSQYLLNGGTKTFKGFSLNQNHINSFFDFKFVEQAYVELFSQENVTCMDYSNLKADAVSFLQQVCKLYHIPFVEFEPVIINKSLSQCQKSKLRIQNRMVLFSLSFYRKKNRNKHFQKYIANLIAKNSK